MGNYFTISEFCISPQLLPHYVADAILVNHILQMNKVREKHGHPIWVSQHSGWRPEEWEKERGRDGTSEHTFKFLWPAGRGAADYTAKDLVTVVKLIKENTNYQRIAYYPHHNFVHCDFKTVSGGRAYFEAGRNKKWKFKNFIK